MQTQWSTSGAAANSSVLKTASPPTYLRVASSSAWWPSAGPQREGAPENWGRCSGIVRTGMRALDQWEPNQPTSLGALCGLARTGFELRVTREERCTEGRRCCGARPPAFPCGRTTSAQRHCFATRPPAFPSGLTLCTACAQAGINDPDIPVLPEFMVLKIEDRVAAGARDCLSLTSHGLFRCLSLTSHGLFRCLSLTSHRLFRCLFLTSHRLSLTSHCLSLTSHFLSLPSHCPLTALP